MRFVLHVSLLLCLLPTGCSGRRDTQTLTLATTTSTQDSGLLDELLPPFRAETGIEVKVVAVGTGQALQLGRRGDADVLLVHDPESETKFMDDGCGESRRPVMHNDFILVGPDKDPAGVRGTKTIAEAFARIARAGTPFVSRGDELGTHQKEKSVWKQAGIEPRGNWYVRAGAGMGQALRMADEKRACTLADRGTFLALRDKLDLVVLAEGDALLRNPYSVIVVSKEKHPGVRAEAARKFADFLRSETAQGIIKEFGVARFGQPLFYPHESDDP